MAVAEARGLKPATVYGHLTKAVARGDLGAGEAMGLSRAQVSRIEDALRSSGRRGSASLGAAFEALGGEFGYEVLRCVLVGMAREGESG